MMAMIEALRKVIQRIVHPLDHLAQCLDHHHPVFRLGSADQHRLTATEPKIAARWLR
jgi:hypothetical protein